MQLDIRRRSEESEILKVYLVKTGLITGFLSLSSALFIARGNPVDGYELSIYSSTPLLFWFFIGLSLGLSLLLSLYSQHIVSSIFLGGASVISILSLPIIRGYYFYGLADGLTHLGIAIDMITGEMAPIESVYPGFHLLSVILKFITPLNLSRSMLFTVVISVSVYFLFVPLCVKELSESDDKMVIIIGSFSGFFLLPINQIATHYMTPHTFSSAILLFPLILFLLFKFLNSTTDLSVASPIGVLLVAASIPIIVFHPLQSALVLIIYITISFSQFSSSDSQNSNHPRDYLPKKLYFVTAYFLIANILWISIHDEASRTSSLLLEELSGLFKGTASAAAVVSSRSSSISLAGGSLSELFFKLFFVSSIFALVAFYPVLKTAIEPFVPEDNIIYKYFYVNRPTRLISLGLVSLLIASSVFFIGEISKYFFRIHGSLMVLVTILGALGIHKIIRWCEGRKSSLPIKLVLSLVLSLFLIQSIAIYYTSPYIYKSSRGITPTEIEGVEAAFMNGDPTINYTTIRPSPGRYLQGLYGASLSKSKNPSFHLGSPKARISNGTVLSNLTSFYKDDIYLINTEYKQQREVKAYNEVRFSKEDFEMLKSPGINRIQSNGEVTLYIVDANRTD